VEYIEVTLNGVFLKRVIGRNGNKPDTTSLMKQLTTGSSHTGLELLAFFQVGGIRFELPSLEEKRNQRGGGLTSVESLRIFLLRRVALKTTA